jgi:translation initiation factor 1
MSRRGGDKVSTEGGDSLSSNAFDSLNLGGLPKGPSGNGSEVKKPAKAKKSKGDRGRVEVRREKAGRGGKTVTTLSAFSPAVTIPALEDLTRSCKKKFACGGVLKGRVVELQGDLAEPVMEALSALGFRPVRAGG